MDDIEGKGFVIKDRRSFSEDGEAKEQKADEAADNKEERKEEERKETAGKGEARRGPLPEVNFNSLIFSLSSSALLHLGEIADPQTGERRKDLPLAKHTIDTIALLKEKTTGNLSEEERKFLESILTDLRFRYVKATQ